MKVCVIGSGTMGSGIGEVFAISSNEVVLYDIYENQIANARVRIEESLGKLRDSGKIKEEPRDIVSRIRFTTSPSDLEGADVYIEAVFEKPEVKAETLKKISEVAPKKAIIGSNTSSISITYLSKFVSNPERFLGIHFFNPVPVMKLVEVVKGDRTQESVVRKVFEMVKALGKEPVISQDFPGFIANRVLVPLIREAILLLEEGVATKNDIDKTVRLGLNHPMGPLELADFIGLDVLLDIMEVMYRDFGDPRFKPPITLRNLVNAGKLGRKSGEGFYKY